MTNKSSLVIRKRSKKSNIEIFNVKQLYRASIALASTIAQKVLNHVSAKVLLIAIALLALATVSIILVLSLRSVDPGPPVFPLNKTIYPTWNDTFTPSETISPSKTSNKTTWIDTLSPSEAVVPSKDETAYPSSRQLSQTVSHAPSKGTTELTMMPTDIGDMPSNKPSYNIPMNPALVAPTNDDNECKPDDDNECGTTTSTPSMSNGNQNNPSPSPSFSSTETTSTEPSRTETPSTNSSSSRAEYANQTSYNETIQPPIIGTNESSINQIVSIAPSSVPTDNQSSTPSSLPVDIPNIAQSSLPTGSPSLEPSSLPTSNPSIAPSPPPSSSPSNVPSSLPTSKPTYTPAPTFLLEETILSDKLFGPSSSTCTNYIPKNGEYSFTFDLSTLPYFDDTLSDVEEVMFEVQMSHIDSSLNRTWSIRLGQGGHIYSFKGPYGESVPPNVSPGAQFVEQVNQKKAVDTAKNDQSTFSVHQSGPFQDIDPGYTDEMPFWFSPNVAIYCSTSIPECRMASWGQQSNVTAWTERIIYYDRYRDCGDGILERTHIIHNAEKEDTNTVLTYTNMPWGGTRFSTLKDFVFSQNPDTWNYNIYNLQGGIEDPMLIFGLDSSYGINRIIPSTWTLGFTIFAQDLPYVEYPSTPPFTFPGRLPADENQPALTAEYGSVNSAWICQGPLTGYTNPDTDNYRCRFANLGITLNKGCSQCNLRFTNSNGDSFAVYNIRHWLVWTASIGCNLLYFNSDETITRIREVVTDGTTITVSWDEKGKRSEDNLALSFVHGRSEGMIQNNENSVSFIRYGHANTVQRDYAVFEYISYPNLAFGDSLRARQYYITDQFSGLNVRSAALASDTIEEVISSGELDLSLIHLHYINDGQTALFGVTVDNSPCHNVQTTTIACTGSSTPQIGKSAFLQIGCGTSTYVGTDFYHFTNYPTSPYRVMNCTVDGVTTSNRPVVKLLGYFSETECGTVLQDKTYDTNFCG